MRKSVKSHHFCEILGNFLLLRIFLLFLLKLIKTNDDEG